MSFFHLIETMRAEPGSGIVRASLHRARLMNSARKLGFGGAEEAWNTVTQRAAELGEMSRLRLALHADGRHEITAAPFRLQLEDTIYRVRIARGVQLSSGQPLLRHKTSERQVYELARAEYSPEEADEVLLTNEKGELCEGTFTNLFVEGDDGILLTPPLSCGCLAGVLRTSLICARKARVSPLRPDDLDRRQAYVGNSLRGLIRISLVP